jgi:hypothetical protein
LTLLLNFSLFQFIFIISPLFYLKKEGQFLPSFLGGFLLLLLHFFITIKQHIIISFIITFGCVYLLKIIRCRTNAATNNITLQIAKIY